jgi:predicted MPP superfamily phosphohydrolase
MKARLFILPVILSLLAFYTHLNLERIFPWDDRTSWLAALGILALIISSQIVDRLKWWPSRFILSRAIVWTGSVLMGLWASFILLSLVVDSGYCLFLLLEWVVPERFTVNGAETEQFIRHAFMLAGVVSCLIALAGLLQAITGPHVKKIAPGFTALPEALRGLKIAQISDLHIGATIHRDYVSRVVKKTMALLPDIIVITGDMVDGSTTELRPYLAPFTQLKARYGIYFITGNHEYYSGVEEWLAEWRSHGFITLINENRIITHNNTAVMIAGVTDLTAAQFVSTHRSDPAKAITSSQESAFKILLAHQPESCFEAEKVGFDLQLSGHTHAGQFFPFTLLVKLAKRYYRGLQRHGRMWLYINPGTGYWGAANRFLVPSEITLITLELAQ